MTNAWADGVGAALIAALVSIIGAMMNSRRAQQVARTAPYDVLATRVARLEVDNRELNKRVNRLESRDREWQRAWGDLQDRWPWWRKQLDPPPPPVPLPRYDYEKEEEDND